MRILRCVGCNKEFSPKNRVYTTIYCSKSCAGKHNKNLGRFKKGQKAWNKDLVGYNSDFPRSKEWKDKIAIANSGKNAPNWMGGVSTENQLARKSREYIKWRNDVFNRDNYTCQECGARSLSGKRVILNADHIKPFALYKELRYSTDNGRTLCEMCHRRTETWGMSILYQRDYTGNKAEKVWPK